MFIVSLVILCCSVLLMLWFNYCFAETVPISILLITSIIYLFGLFGNLYIGIIILLLSIIILLIYSAIKKRLFFIRIVKQLFTDPVFYVYILLCILIHLYNNYNYFNSPDEWGHWGEFVTDLFYRNKLYNTAGHLYVNHLSYPPFSSLFEYFYVKTNNTLSMPNLYRAYQLLCFSLYFPVLKDLKSKKSIKSIIAFATIGIIVIIYFILSNRLMTFNSNPAYSIVADSLVGLLFGYYLISILNFDIDSYNVIRIIIAGVALVLSKQIGVALFLICIVSFYFIQIIENKIHKKNFIKQAMVFIIPFLFYISWKIIVFKNNVIDQFDLNRTINLKQLIEILFFGGGTIKQKTVTKNFISWIFTMKLIIMTPLQWFIFYAVILVVLCTIFYKVYNNKIIILSINMFLGLLLYMFSLLCLYYFAFNVWETEAIELASIWRYTGTYLLGITYFANYLLITLLIQNKHYIFLTIALITLSISLIYSSYISNTYKKVYLPKKRIDYYDAKKRFDNYFIIQNEQRFKRK